MADYMPSLPISFDNKPPTDDRYSGLLPTGAEQDSELVQRFGVWQRPLPTQLWPQNRAFAINAAIEVTRAARIGLDGFLVDLIATKGQHWEWTMLLLDAAAASSSNFRIAVEPDMNALTDATVSDLVTTLDIFYRHPAGFRLDDGRLLVVPFKPDNRPLSFWRELKARMDARGQPIALVPETLAIAQLTTFVPVADGLTFWGERTPSSGPSQLAEARHLTRVTGLPVMMPVAPQDFRPKSGLLWEARNSETFRSQWSAAIESEAPWVHVITWNDYSEATEIAPSSTTQFIFYDLAAYYIFWFKNGQPPDIKRDALFYTFRSQIFDPTETTIGQKYQLRGSTPISNNIELIGFLEEPGILQIELNGKVWRQSVGAGLQILTIPAQAGRPCFRLLRAGKSVITLPAAVEIADKPVFKDGLYGGGSSLRPYVSMVSRRPGRPLAPAQNLATGQC
ncbi:glycoside hydrolase family 71 protein [Hephaestia sp. GCM10023244]|uniref:glycoside hydrolase family 71 protein n=1 Tax=unclassified Hephaestia TaxID=2631281 RepID=UPI0020779574|nr:glycoside hydrolase family 71 protein [Hephaestia sp. MAHUQ-44]MCM8732548.1 glycoside hydrolase family 71 protein [Hephaestia sp. MAHUQ-44]